MRLLLAFIALVVFLHWPRSWPSAWRERFETSLVDQGNGKIQQYAMALQAIAAQLPDPKTQLPLDHDLMGNLTAEMYALQLAVGTYSKYSAPNADHKRDLQTALAKTKILAQYQDRVKARVKK